MSFFIMLKLNRFIQIYIKEQQFNVIALLVFYFNVFI